MSEIKPIAHILTPFPEKFGIPRQSGLADIKGTVVFEPEYRVNEALKGLEEYSHLWLIWEFSEAKNDKWSPTVRPPRLGGNVRMGVFATRSPFRPNSLGLSCVKLDGIEYNTKLGTVLHVSGADMVNNTPVFDIKPYLAFSDSIPDASGGFSDRVREHALTVIYENSCDKVPDSAELGVLTSVLSGDPRPSYQTDKDRIYAFEFSDYNIRFCVDENILTVKSICRIKEKIK